jgi:HEPN domain
VKNPAQIRKLAIERLEEAQILAQNGKYDGAFYLAGYSIELMLKAKVCEQFGVDNLFDEVCKFPGASEVRRAIKTHDIAVLFIFSGLRNKFECQKYQ